MKTPLLLPLLVSILCATSLCAQTVTVRGHVEVGDETVDAGSSAEKGRESVKHAAKTQTMPSTIVWLTPAPGSGIELPAPSTAAGSRLVQKNKNFEPHVLVVSAGSTVEFPNHDPFFHNVFSLFEGKRFDLGLYEAGTTRTVRFDRPGISYIFCNIHPEMSAVVITLTTPIYAAASPDGQVSLAGVPYGRYLLHVWSEGMTPENDKMLDREITISEGATTLGVIRVPRANGQRIAHKNKYGRDYDKPTPDSTLYEQH